MGKKEPTNNDNGRKSNGRNSHFTFRGIPLPYFDHDYNHASQNMRSVEVPIVIRYIKTMRKINRRARILEVGNVLNHYGFEGKRQIVDVREKGERVHNVNIMDWKPGAKFDLIISISTVEHIGFGEHEKHTGGAVCPVDVIDKLKSLLAPNGVMVVTAPTNYNPVLDVKVRLGKLGVDHMWFMKRTSDANEWVQCDKDEALKMKYSRPWKWGGGMMVLQCGEFDWTEFGFQWEDIQKDEALNLGAGNAIMPNAINHDIAKHSAGIDIAHDLNVLPWPWEDETFKLIVSRAVFEHLDFDLLTAMNEAWRIMKPHGRIFVKLPYWDHDRCWEDPTHRRGFALAVFDWFDPSTRNGKMYNFYIDRKWKIIKRARLNSAKTSILCTLEKIGNDGK